MPGQVNITNPPTGSSTSDTTPTVDGVAAAGAGDSTTVDVKLYAGSSATGTPTRTGTDTMSGTAFSVELTPAIGAGTYTAVASQNQGTVVAGVGFAMSQGPTGSHWGPDADPVSGQWTRPANNNGSYGYNAFSLAADFYDACAAINHHWDYFGQQVTPTAIALLQEIGIRHVRMGLASPVYDSRIFNVEAMASAAAAVKTANANRAAGVQPITLLLGTYAPPTNFSPPYQWTFANWYRHFDGPAGTNSTPYTNDNPGPATFHIYGWSEVGALQGPNEPGNQNTVIAEGPGSLRWVYQGLIAKTRGGPEATKNAAGGGEYIDSTTGRIAAGPAKVPQVPVFGFGGVGGLANYQKYGDYTDRQDIDYGAPHFYWGGHEPWFGPTASASTGQWADWGNGSNNNQFNTMVSYNGAEGPGRFVRTIPMVVTEQGYYTGADQARAPADQFCVPDVAAEYLIRCMLQNYIGGIKRTYWYKLMHESGGSAGAFNGPPAMGHVDNTNNYAKLGPFYAHKNLLKRIGWREPVTATPISVGVETWNGTAYVSGWLPGPTNKINGQPSWDTASPDRLDKLITQTEDAASSGAGREYLIWISRNRTIWQRVSRAPVGVNDPKLLRLTLPAGSWRAFYSQPARNPANNPSDGLSYPGLGTDGMQEVELTIDSSNRISDFQVGGLTSCIRIVEQVAPADALQARVKTELDEFADWVAAQGVAGCLGEFGAPGNPNAPGYVAGDQGKWAALLSYYYGLLQTRGLSSMQWGVFPTRIYELAPYISSSNNIMSNLTTALPSSGALEAHKGDALMRGVAMSGLEDATGNLTGYSNTNPGSYGTNYFDYSQASWSFVGGRGVRSTRIPFRIENLQPTLGAAFPSGSGSYLALLQGQVARAKAAQFTQIVLDAHNFAGYFTSAGEQKLGSAGFTQAHFVDFCTRLAQAFSAEPAVTGLEPMNEPVAMPGGVAGWKTISQAGFDAIMAVNTRFKVFINGYNWAKVQGWAALHGNKWITGPNAAKCVYTAHQYFDTESSTNGKNDSVYQYPYATGVSDSSTSTGLTGTPLDDPTWRPYSIA